MNLTADCPGERPSRADLRRRRLIETARELFIENGFHATGIAQIARESGIAVGQIYRDFGSKEDIVAALVQADCGRLMRTDALNAAIRAGDRELVRAWLGQFITPDDDQEGARLFAEIVAESSRNERIAAVFTVVQDELRANLLAALALLAPGTEAARRAVTADTIMTFSLGLLHHGLMRPGLDVHAVTDELQDFIDLSLVTLRCGESIPNRRGPNSGRAAE